jgi:hypothetical protein
MQEPLWHWFPDVHATPTPPVPVVPPVQTPLTHEPLWHWLPDVQAAPAPPSVPPVHTPSTQVAPSMHWVLLVQATQDPFEQSPDVQASSEVQGLPLAPRAVQTPALQ